MQNKRDSNLSNKLIDLIKERNPELSEVALHPDYLLTAQSPSNGPFLDYLFGKGDKDFGKLEEILTIILTNTKSNDEKKKNEEGTFFTDERKVAHNLCTIFTNKNFKEKKMAKILKEESGFTDKLKTFIQSNPEDNILTSRFCQLIKAVISVDDDYIPSNKWILSPLLAFPDRVGFSNLLFTILRVQKKFYKFTAKRCYDFMRVGEKENNLNFMKNSFILLNIFSLLIKSDEFDIKEFEIEAMKNILDATLIGQRVYKLAFYDGIFVTTSILKKVNTKSAIARYVKARGKAFYDSFGLFSEDTIITPDMELDKYEWLKDAIAAFPAFYRSGFKKLYPLMFRKNDVVSSDFGRVCLDYITKMPEAKFISFIDNKNIPELIMSSLPLPPNDPEVLEKEENIQYLNPHVILLAFYIIEGLPKNRESGDNRIVKNEYYSEKFEDQKFVDFIVKNLLPFRPLVLPNLDQFHLEHTVKPNAT